MADTVFTIPNERLHCTLKGFTASVNQEWLVIIWGGIKGAVVVICASLFTIKKGAGKSMGEFIGDLIREPQYSLEFQLLRSRPCEHVLWTCMAFAKQHHDRTKSEGKQIMLNLCISCSIPLTFWFKWWDKGEKTLKSHITHFSPHFTDTNNFNIFTQFQIWLFFCCWGLTLLPWLIGAKLGTSNQGQSLYCGFRKAFKRWRISPMIKTHSQRRHNFYNVL